MLAHIRRQDVLVNLLQAFIEVLFFHHPAAWWISAQIRSEREFCADDLAVQILDSGKLGTRLSYAQALLALEERRASPAFSVAARGGSLIDRIRRLAGVVTPSPSPAKLIAGSLATACLMGFLLTGLFLPKPLTANEPSGTRRTQNFQDGVVALEPPIKDPKNTTDTTTVTEAIATAISERLWNAGVPQEPRAKIRDAMWEAIRAGKPLSLEQVHARLAELGIDPQTLHADPRNPPKKPGSSATIFIGDKQKTRTAK